MSGSSKCKSCQRPIVWAVSTNGKNVPFDPDPVPDGNMVLVSSVRDGKIHFDAFAYHPTAYAGQKRYRSHFVTCPNAKFHRRR